MRNHLIAISITLQWLGPLVKSQTIPQPAANVQVAYKLSSTRVSLHEPIFMSMTIANNSGEVLNIDLGQDRKQAIYLSIQQPDGRIVSASLPLHGGLSAVGLTSIASGHAYQQTVVLNEWYAFDAIGNYVISVRLGQIGGQQQLPELKRQTALPIEIVERDPERLAEICGDLRITVESSSSYANMAEATLALSYINDPIAVPYLQDVAPLHSGMVAPIAIKGLARIDGTSGVTALISLSRQKTPEIRSLARASLAQVMLGTKDPSLKEKIRQALENR